MPREILSCPYCNSSVPLSVPGQMGQRIRCPLCEETFPYRPGERIEGNVEEPLEQKPTDQPQARRLWSNGALALAILVGMATIAVLTLTFAELTLQLRRSHDLALPGRRAFTLPVAGLGAMLIYVMVLAAYVGRLLARRDKPLAAPARMGATGLLILLALIALADLYGIVRRLGPSQPPMATGPGTASDANPMAAVEPAQLVALAYLPSDTNVLLGVHVREAMQHPLGRDILERWQAGPGEATLAAMARWTGMEPADVDHVVVGLKMDDSLFPAIRVVVRTRKPYDADRLRASLKAGRPATRLDKTIYRFGVPRSPLEPVVWFGDERTLVFALTPEDLDDVPLKASEGLARLAPPLQQALAEMKSGTQLWLAGHSSDWRKSLLGLPLLQVPKEAQTLLKEVRTFAAWLQLAANVNFELALGCADATSAGKVGDYLTRQGFEPGRPVPFLGQQPEMKLLARELSQSLQRSQNGDWIFMTASATQDSVRRAVEAGPR